MAETGAGVIEQPHKEITSLIDKSVYTQMPFRDPSVQSFMGVWCEVNDSIRPQFIDREEWDKHRETGLLEPRKDGMKTLFLTEDMQLPEMIDVVKTIDQDTFSETPEKANEHTDKLKRLGETFRNSGIYIAQRLASIDEGRVLAETTARDFYVYGESLLAGKTLEDGSITEIADKELTKEDTQIVDQWLAGENLYKARMKSVERRVSYNTDPTKSVDALRDQYTEEMRKNSLAQYFRTADASLKVFLERKDPSGNEVDIAFLAKAKSRMYRQIEAPIREVDASIMRRGMELLNKTMGFDRLKEELDPIIQRIDAGEEVAPEEYALASNLVDVITTFDKWRNNETTLREGLRIADLKEELTKVRATGDTEAVVQKEQEITATIQDAVSTFPFENGRSNPADVTAEQSLNCVGASLLAGAFLSEVGINYLVADLPAHSTLLVVTSDDSVFYHDMLHPPTEEEARFQLGDAFITGERNNGQLFSIQDIIDESRHPSGRLLKLEAGGKFVVSHPTIGHQRQVMNNAGVMLEKLGRYDERNVVLQKMRELSED